HKELVDLRAQLAAAQADRGLYRGMYIDSDNALTAAYNNLAAAQAKLDQPSRSVCPVHPEVNYRHEWGCPRCLTEVLADLATTRAQLAASEARVGELRTAMETEGIA